MILTSSIACESVVRDDAVLRSDPSGDCSQATIRNYGVAIYVNEESHGSREPYPRASWPRSSPHSRLISRLIANASSRIASGCCHRTAGLLSSARTATRGARRINRYQLSVLCRRMKDQGEEEA